MGYTFCAGHTFFVFPYILNSANKLQCVLMCRDVFSTKDVYKTYSLNGATANT